MVSPDGPRVLFFDIETAPALSWIWSLWQEPRNPDMLEADWYILCWAAKWQGEDEVVGAALPDHGPLYRRDPTNDSKILARLRELLDEADIVVAHNAKRFDVPRVNARLLLHGLPPPSPYRVVDTLAIARSTFAFMSNKLDALAKSFGLGSKLPTGGFGLWRDVMAGDMKAWERMCRYCGQDVRLLEQVYHRMLPYSKGTPNAGVYAEGSEVLCAKCGSSDVKRSGYAYTQVGRYQRYVCHDCGAWSRGRVSDARPKLTSV